MKIKHSIMNRVIIGKSIGFIVGALSFFILPMIGVPLDIYFGLGLWLFYIMLGVLIAFFGVMDHHPMLKFKMPWWFRGIFMGLTMHLMLILLAFGELTFIMDKMHTFGFNSPWWMLLDGVLLGLIMSYAETKLAGEGKLPLV
jgi:hypothetical protein